MIKSVCPENKTHTLNLCRGEATRTPDPYVPNVVRYQLRYTPIFSISTTQCAFWASLRTPFTGAILLLHHVGAFGCWVSPLTRCAPP